MKRREYEGRLQEVACPLCGADSPRLRFRDPPFAVQSCGSCALVYVSPRLEAQALAELVYGADYWKSDNPSRHGYADYEAAAPLYRLTYERRLPLIQKHRPEAGRLLDVGCSNGVFLELMQERGWEVQGLEPSESAARTAAERLGPGRVRQCALQDFDAGGSTYDLITLWDVIEHLPAPLEALDHLRALLAPGGLLLIETQDVGSLAARLLGRRWHHYKQAEHLFHLDRRSLGELLRRGGFEPLELGHGRAGKYVSGDFISERSGRLFAWLPRLLGPALRGLQSGIYINLFDEFIVIARPRKG